MHAGSVSEDRRADLWETYGTASGPASRAGHAGSALRLQSFSPRLSRTAKSILGTRRGTRRASVQLNSSGQMTRARQGQRVSRSWHRTSREGFQVIVLHELSFVHSLHSWESEGRSADRQASVKLDSVAWAVESSTPDLRVCLCDGFNCIRGSLQLELALPCRSPQEIRALACPPSPAQARHAAL